ncbi:MAG TPA: succinylglutamate desuccinylase/aspartoacylase family protein [Sedimentisphaerales bacterium]|nr:succinylglutamate desuccinylase/aspartoacylase family protein [Sedimentisphaerales bacterium]
MKKDKTKRKYASQRVRYSFLKILTGSDLSRRRLPFMSIQSPTSGPVVWLTGCIHGDEVTGIVAIQEVFKRIQKQHLIKGSLHAFPLMNPIGFETASRNITLSREDLNRAFPGSKTGSLAERIADRILSTITQTNPALVLDLHNDWMKSIPYTLIDPNPGGANKAAYDKAKAVAEKSGFLTILETEEPAKTFSYSLLQQNIPALTIELGESYVVNEKNVEYGVKSILAILAYLEMIERTDEAFSLELPEPVKGKILKLSNQPVSSASGIIRFLANPGDIVKKGQVVAKIYNTFGKLMETMLSQDEGIVLGYSDSSVAFPGAPIMAFGVI